MANPVGVAAYNKPDSEISYIMVVVDDGSVWYLNDPEGLWLESQPVPGTERARTYPKNKGQRPPGEYGVGTFSQ